MDKKSFFDSIRDEGASFFNAVSKASEPFYLILISLYVAIYIFLKIAFKDELEPIIEMFRLGLLGLVMWGAAIYFFFVLVEWKNLWKRTGILLIVAAVILIATFFLSKNMSTNVYGVVMDLFFCIMIYGKDYKKVLRCNLIVIVFLLLLAGVGVPLKYTYDLVKPNYVSTTHSLGINYPNTWGYIVFLALMIIWYLYLRFKPILTFFIFWVVTWFMFVYISCNTIAALTAVFPVFALIVDLLEKNKDLQCEKAIDTGGIEDASEKRENKLSSFRSKIIGWGVTAIPFLSFAFMLFASMQVEWMHKTFYGNRLKNFAYRFVQGGLYFRTYGFPLVGNPYRSNQYTYVNVNGEFIQVGILDSSFAAYLIMRGILWMIYTLLWLCIANRRAIKKRDYAIPFLGAIILLFAMMERPGLEMWFNFILLYPLAKVASKPGTTDIFDWIHKKKTASATVTLTEAVDVSNDKADESDNDSRENVEITEDVVTDIEDSAHEVIKE